MRAAVDRLHHAWQRMPGGAWSRPTAARVGTRPAWMSVWARWRETEIHHLDLDIGYRHGHWPPEFVELMLPRILPTLAGRVTGDAPVQVQVTDRLAGESAPGVSSGAVVVRGAASAVVCWLAGRPVTGDLTICRFGRPWPLPHLRPWA